MLQSQFGWSYPTSRQGGPTKALKGAKGVNTSQLGAAGEVDCDAEAERILEGRPCTKQGGLLPLS
jgi:hypothetical protein